MMTSGSSSGSSSQLVKVKREKIVACMTCPLCYKLFTDATTIPECLHTFCRKCITDKITEEHLYHCPVCKASLCSNPIQKLRADNSLQELRLKLFALDVKKHKEEPSIEGRKGKEPEVAPPAPLSPLKKERTLSSLGISTPEVTKQGVTMGKRRRRSAARRVNRRDPINQPRERPMERVEEHPAETSTPPGPASENASDKIQDFSAAESSKRKASASPTKEIVEPAEGRGDQGRPVNLPIEAASGSQLPVGSTSQEAVETSVPLAVHETRHHKGKRKELEAQEKEKVSIPVPSGSEKSGSIRIHNEEKSSGVAPASARPRRTRRQQTIASAAGVSITPQVVVDAQRSQPVQELPSFWFKLQALPARDGYSPLPQISSPYLRVKNINLPLSVIKKYLAEKLGLHNHAEVEIIFQGYAMLPTLQLGHLVESWLQSLQPLGRFRTSLGSSAKNFVMELNYAQTIHENSQNRPQ